jgi:luciferase family oxidoreductase group 1
MSVPLSILDLAPVGTGFGVEESLRRSTELAQRAEALGYTRFWVAEHHNMPGIASTAPEVLIAHLSAVTSSIRVGSGGVMLPNHAPLAVAERFGMLEALHPGRIDLALGRAPGTDQFTSMALHSRGAGMFPEEVQEIGALLRGELGRLSAVSSPDTSPDIWVLGSSGDGAAIAAALGAGYAHAHHIGPRNTVGALETYRETFTPGVLGEHPRTIVASIAVAADTEEEAKRQAWPVAVSMAQLRAGKPGKLSSADEAERIKIDPRFMPVANARIDNAAIGTPEQVHERLEDLRSRSGADELMLLTMLHSQEARLHSYELIAQQYGLAGAGELEASA